MELPERRGAESDIGWWLFHQWVDHGLRGTQDHWTAYTDLTARLPLGGTALGALFHRRRTGQLLYGLRLSLGEMCRQERLERLETLASVTGGVGGIGGMGMGVPQQVRVRRLAALLAVARARALDIPALLQAADCHHEAVVEALRRHVGQADAATNDSDVPLPLLLGAAYELRRPVPEIGARLESYGLRVPYLPTNHASDRVGLWTDIMLLSKDLSGPDFHFRASPLRWLTLGHSLRIDHLCAASTKLGIPLAEVAVRLRGLGVDVPDVADTIRAAMARLPRRSREQNPD
ncbi:hypothetical protein SMA5143A_4509 [Streptomyces sp. MA5143a]|nr:hypothetical protein [Streptomyces sp. MA5143a]SPF03725.1 hypothetical protein SMA5143A_4509 [Streptomyces sp. MA5143a]